MPIYEYRCTSCGHELEALQKFSDAPLTECPACQRRRADQARLRRGLPAQGQRLVRHRLQGQRQARRRPRRGGKPAGAKSSDEATAGGQAGDAERGRSRRRAGLRRRRRQLTQPLNARRAPRVTMKRYLIAGLLVWVPLGITIWVLHFLVTTLDQTLLLVPESAAARKRCSASTFPGLGVVLSFAILLRPASSPRTSSASG